MCNTICERVQERARPISATFTLIILCSLSLWIEARLIGAARRIVTEVFETLNGSNLALPFLPAAHYTIVVDIAGHCNLHNSTYD